MAKREIEQQVRELRAQADATRRAAETADGSTKDLACAAAATIESVARSHQRKLKSEPVLELPMNASASEISQARQRRAVRRGQDVYLPSWREAAVGLPNLLLRSALFSATTAGDSLFEAPIASQGDTVLTMTGPQLCDYDRRAFAVCLNYYRDDRPLSSGADPKWVKVSFWQLAQDLKVAYGANTHKAIRESLVRLNAAHIRIRVKRQDIPMPRLIEVAFDDGYLGRDTPNHLLRGSDLVAFKVSDSVANLFGPADWSAISESALHNYSGLPSWLTSYYGTHASPYPLRIVDLHKYSGSVCELREFRRRLKTALTKLQKEEIPIDFRVAGFEQDKTHVTVKLVRWQKS
jgi:hypothetical protein